MSNETDLDWLARDVNDWPDSSCGYINTMKIKGITYPSWSRYSGEGKFTKDQWLARRAELQNKPSWKDAIPAAEYLAQDASGGWTWFGHAPERYSDRFDAGPHGYEEYSDRSGEVIGDWRDTLERRPADLSELAVTERLQEATNNVLAAAPELKSDKYKFDPLTSIEDSQEMNMGNKQDVNQDNGWFERGELPPAGIECEVRAKGDDWKRVITIGTDNEGAMVVQFLDDAIPYHGCNLPNRFRPIRTERDELIGIIASNLSGTTGQVADAILAAGFMRVGGA